MMSFSCTSVHSCIGRIRRWKSFTAAILVVCLFENWMLIDSYAFTNKIMSKRNKQVISRRIQIMDQGKGCFYKPGSRSDALSMRDRSCSDAFEVGKRVKVITTVMKGGIDLKGQKGEDVKNWIKCEVDPTCCCAEQVDLGMAVLVEFDCSVDGGSFVPRGETFTHYFGEDELIHVTEKESAMFAKHQIPFDGMSCKAFKLEHLKMGQQAKRLAAFEEVKSIQDESP